MNPQISVVIPTFKRPQLLERCLDALDNQSLEKKLFEINVVSDGPDKKTAELVNKYKKLNNNINYYSLPSHKGPAAARNLGVKNSQGRLIAFTDDDTIPDSNWLNEGYKEFQKGSSVITGKVIVPINGIPTDYEKTISNLETAEFITANCFIEKKIFNEVGGFDEQFEMAWREDSDLHFKILKKGVEINKSNDAIVVHPVRTAPWGISIYDQKKSQYNALLYKKHPQLFIEKIQKWPNKEYLIIVFSFILATALSFFDYPFLAEILFSIWVLFTVKFTAMRLKGTSHEPNHLLEMASTSLFIPFLSIFWRIYGAFKFKVFFI